jgi:zinc transport system substrate-binding protein
MKRFICVLLAAALAAALAGCAGGAARAGDNTLSVVCTVFPQYDWAREILGDNPGGVELTFLINNRVDLHSFQPSASDMVRVTECDLFIYVGGESDSWVDGALGNAANEDMVVISLLEALGDAAKEEDVIEGMEDDEGDEDGEEEEGPEYDEHVWLSLRNAKTLCAAIAEALSQLDPANAAVYRSNLAAYTAKLDALDAEYGAAVDAAPVRTLLVADRFPFRYLVDDYGLDYYAAFPGCSAETEASFKTIIFLADKADELGLNTIVVTESADRSIAGTVRDNTRAKNQQIVVLDAMQSVTQSDASGGMTYLSIMEDNLAVLKEALK